MDVNTIVSLVTSLGFPVAMCLVLCWYIVKRMDSTNDAIMSMISNNNTVLSQCVETNRHNTEVLEKVLTVLTRLNT